MKETYQDLIQEDLENLIYCMRKKDTAHAIPLYKVLITALGSADAVNEAVLKLLGE